MIRTILLYEFQCIRCQDKLYIVAVCHTHSVAVILNRLVGVNRIPSSAYAGNSACLHVTFAEFLVCCVCVCVRVCIARSLWHFV